MTMLDLILLCGYLVFGISIYPWARRELGGGILPFLLCLFFWPFLVYAFMYGIIQALRRMSLYKRWHSFSPRTPRHKSSRSKRISRKRTAPLVEIL